MATPQRSIVPSSDRVSTGNVGLDAMLEGGFVPRRPYLIVGPSGTGKTTLALQFLAEGVRAGERVLLVTLEEPPNEARVNHRGLLPALDAIEVFDAIPDIMRYERTPFKDIASVRAVVPFGKVPPKIRQTPELSSVEVTITALEQMLRSEVARKGYSRIVIDSMTALQYFCMKGFDPVAGAQTFLRFVSDLGVTTVLTVESPLEDADTPERMLARGEIRLFRWELDGQSVRAIGVEKFRGSAHDVRLHPYRIGPKGIDINLAVTISRDTRQIIEAPAPTVAPEVPAGPTTPFASLEREVSDFVLVGAPLEPLRAELEGALVATARGDRESAQGHLARAAAITVDLAHAIRSGEGASVPIGPGAGEAYQRIRDRADASRAGVPPFGLPEPPILKGELERLIELIPPRVAPASPPPAPTPPPPPVVPTASDHANVAPRPEFVPPAEPAPEPEPEVEPVPEPPIEPATEPAPEPGIEAETEPVPEPRPEPEPTAAATPVAEPTGPGTGPLEPAPVGASEEPSASAEPSTPAESSPPAPGLEPEPASGGEPVPAPTSEPPTRHQPVPEPPVAPAPPSLIDLVPHVTPSASRDAHRAEPPPLPSLHAPEAPPPQAAGVPSAERKPAAEAGAKKRKKAPAPKRRPAPKTAPAPPAPAPTPVRLAPRAPEAAPRLPEPIGSPAASKPIESAEKPKRRATRKRKAPPVVAATPGPMPIGDLGSPPPPPPATEDAPSTEDGR